MTFAMTNKASFGVGSGTALDGMPQPPCAKFLGYEFLSVDRAAKSVRVKFTATAGMLNPVGTVQGGFLSAMLDDAMGSMVVVLTDGEKGPMSVDLHTQFFRPGKPGALIAEARLKHMTRSTVFTEATLYDEAGKAVAAATQTARLFPLKEQSK